MGLELEKRVGRGFELKKGVGKERIREKSWNRTYLVNSFHRKVFQRKFTTLLWSQTWFH